VDTDEKNVELFRNGLSIQLLDHLVLFPNLTYNALANAAIDQEGTIKVCVEAEEKKRKRVMSGHSGGTPPKYRLVYMPLVGQLHQPPQQ
jgi:hypothetical protein